MRGTKNRVVILLGVAVVLFGCNYISPKKQKKTAPAQAKVQVSGIVIAKVNNHPITLEELNAEVENFNSYVPENRPEEKIDTRDKKIGYLKNEMIRKTLLWQAAMDRGLDRKDDVVSALDNFKHNLLVAELVRAETVDVEVTSAEIEDYYNRSKDQLKEPEERRIREILVSNENDAKDILIQLLQGADFVTLAQGRSTSATAQNGGDLGFIRKGVKSPQFDEVAFSASLEIGKASNYFKAPEGYYILKLDSKREGKVKGLSELWDDIKSGLTFLKQQKKLEELIGKLSRDGKIEVTESAVK